MTDEDVEQEVEELLAEVAEYDDLEQMLEDLDDDEVDDIELEDGGSLKTMIDDAGE